MNYERQSPCSDNQLTALRAAIRLTRASSEQLTSELISVARSVLGFSHVVVLALSRDDGTCTEVAPSHSGSLEADIVRLVSNDSDLRKMIFVHEPHVQLELHASDVPFHPSFAWFIGAGLRHLYACGLTSNATDQLALVGVDSRAVMMSKEELEVLDLLVCIASNELRSGATVSDLEERVDHLQRALGSRVIIEQAKGALAERLKTSPDEAFEHLRQSARRARVSLPLAASSVIGSAVVKDSNLDAGNSDSVGREESDNTEVHGFTS